jgi:MFS family permease
MSGIFKSPVNHPNERSYTMLFTKIINTFKFTFRTLKYRNYRMFFMGQSVSLIGMWIQNVAMGWLVYRLTDSAFLLGVVGFAENIPMFILTPFAGVLVDRWDRHRTVVVTQTLAMCLAIIMAILVLSGSVTVWHIIIISILLGTVMAVDVTARQSLFVDLVDNKEDLGNAIALNSIMFNSARLIGPSIAGIVIVALGEGLCFLLNGISYIGLIAALLLMKIVTSRAETKRTDFWQELKEGLKYATGYIPIRYTFLLLALISFMANPYLVLMPVFAKGVLGGGAQTLGYLVGCSGLGALTGAIFVASQKSNQRLVKLIFGGAFSSGIGFIIFSFSRILVLSLVSIFIISFGIMMIISFSNILIQTIVDDNKRGRVMALHVFALSGMTPFGNLFLGSVSSRIGAPHTFLIVGLIVVLGALAYGYKRIQVELV